MVKWNELQIGDTYEENGVTYLVTAISNTNGLIVSAQPII